MVIVQSSACGIVSAGFSLLEQRHPSASSHTSVYLHVMLQDAMQTVKQKPGTDSGLCLSLVLNCLSLSQQL